MSNCSLFLKKGKYPLLNFIKSSIKSWPGGPAKRIVCYHTNWGKYRPGNKKFEPENIDPKLCTHIIYSFANLTNYEISATDGNDESIGTMRGLYERTIDLKKKNPILKISLAIGGK